METVILVIGEDCEEREGLPSVGATLAHLLKGIKGKIVLVNLLPETSTENSPEEHRCWHSLFTLAERYKNAGFSVAVATERGTPFHLLEIADRLHPTLLAMPKEKFLLLGPEENDDFLNRLTCPILIY